MKFEFSPCGFRAIAQLSAIVEFFHKLGIFTSISQFSLQMELWQQGKSYS
ncbi:MAG: hypothetical protein HC903_15585 [Methylacidiphilales bacterium]|nr:hypothetical protein [Candidatus Methylacidiphilales bacterium]NJR15204.1 hypothetical protein [Calothrix sp. CSU_2_0]